MQTDFIGAIASGEKVGFEEFALHTARELPLFEGADAPPSEAAKAYEAMTDALRRARISLETLQALSDEEWNEHARLGYDRAVQQEKDRSDYAQRLQNLIDYRDFIESWQSPSDEHRKLRTKMVRKLNDAIKKDVVPRRNMRPVAKESGARRKLRMIAEAQARITDLERELDRMRTSVDLRTQFVADLRASAPQRLA